MNKSTKSISLVLIGSALALAGCSPGSDDDEARHGGGAHAGPYMRGGSRFRGGGAAVGAGASARGGFGGIGAHGGGS